MDAHGGVGSSARASDDGDGDIVIDSTASSPKRARLWPHVVGNFASCVRLPVHGPPLAQAIAAAIRQAEKALGVVFVPIPLEQLHVSVTRTFPVVKASVPRFTRLVCAAVRDADMEPLRLVVSRTPRVLANDVGATSFLALTIDASSSGDALDCLNELAAALDDVLTTLALPTFYQPALFHVSVAWTEGDHSATVLPAIDAPASSSLAFVTRCDQVDVVVGDAVHTFELR